LASPPPSAPRWHSRTKRTVVCFTGDGSILMNIQELVTAGEENVNLKIVLMNNASLGLVHQQQTLFYGERLFASQFKAITRFHRRRPARFGIAAVDLDLAANPCAALMEAISRPGPVPDSRQHGRRAEGLSQWCRRAPPITT
jgi:acetolactate synthase-1/2/3 large subunit